MNKFKERLNELIKEKGINKKTLAEEIEASKALITIWTQGKSLPTVEYIIKLADYFEVCTDYLLGRQDWY